MQTIAIANQKGGVGKTTTTLAIGEALATMGRRVLLVDMDPQSSLTQWLGIDAQGASLAEVIGGVEPGPLAMPDIIRNVTPGLDLAPADIALSGCELGLVQRLGREYALKQALATVGNYDIALIDCPPSLGLLTAAGLTAAHAVIVPTLPAAADLRGLGLFLTTLGKIRRAVNPGLQLLGVVVTQAERRRSHTAALAAMQGAGLPVLLPTVPRTVRLQEAAGKHLAPAAYDPTGKATEAYKTIASEVNAWLTKTLAN